MTSKIGAALATGLLALLLTASAGAAQTRVLQQTFGSAASTVVDPAPLKEPQGVAVNTDGGSSSLGDVYVADMANNRVEKFNEKGAVQKSSSRAASRASRSARRRRSTPTTWASPRWRARPTRSRPHSRSRTVST